VVYAKSDGFCMTLTGASRDAEGMVRFSHNHDDSVLMATTLKMTIHLIIECL
jgi:hypothetical protein